MELEKKINVSQARRIKTAQQIAGKVPNKYFILVLWKVATGCGWARLVNWIR